MSKVWRKYILMETFKFVFSFVSTFASTLWLLWLIFVYPYSNISMKSAWLGTAAGFFSAIILVILVSAVLVWKD